MIVSCHEIHCSYIYIFTSLLDIILIFDMEQRCRGHVLKKVCVGEMLLLNPAMTLASSQTISRRPPPYSQHHLMQPVGQVEKIEVPSRRNNYKGTIVAHVRSFFFSLPEQNSLLSFVAWFSVEGNGKKRHLRE
jgi:hypothetical protein